VGHHRITRLSASAISRLPAPSAAALCWKPSPAAVASPPSRWPPPVRSVAGDGVDVPGGHRPPVEAAGRWATRGSSRWWNRRFSRLPRRRWPRCRPGSRRTAAEPGPDGRAAVTGECVPHRSRRQCRCARRSSAARRRYRSCAPHPDAVVAGVGDHEVAREVDGHTPRLIKPGPGRRAAIAAEPGDAVPGDDVDMPAVIGRRRRYRSCAPPSGPGRCPGRRSAGCPRRRRHTLRLIKPGPGRRAAITGVPGLASPATT